MTTLRDEYEKFAEKCIPPGAGEGQLRQLRNAFMAGAVCAYTLSVDGDLETLREEAAEIADEIIAWALDHGSKP